MFHHSHFRLLFIYVAARMVLAKQKGRKMNRTNLPREFPFPSSLSSPSFSFYFSMTTASHSARKYMHSIKARNIVLRLMPLIFIVFLLGKLILPTFSFLLFLFSLYSQSDFPECLPICNRNIKTSSHHTPSNDIYSRAAVGIQKCMKVVIEY